MAISTVLFTFTASESNGFPFEPGERSLLIRLLSQNIGPLPEGILASLNRLPSERLSELSRQLFSIDSLSALQTWLDNQTEDNQVE